MSIHRSEAEILRRRSLEFIAYAGMALERGSYDIACFLAEQALQLYLKHILLLLVGDYPRTHSIRRLLGDVCRVTGSKKLDEYIRSNRVLYSLLEDAYLMARYFMKEYTREDAEELVRPVTETIKLLEKLIGGR